MNKEQDPVRRASVRLTIGASFLIAVVLIGLIVFVVLADESSYQREKDRASVAFSFIFSPALSFYIQDRAPVDMYILQFASAVLSIVGAVSAFQRKNWLVAWVGSVAGLSFSFLALISVYLVGVSYLAFQGGLVPGDGRPRALRARSTFVGVMAAIVVAILGGVYGIANLFEAVTGNASLAFLATELFLLLIFFLFRTVHSVLSKNPHET